MGILLACSENGIPKKNKIDDLEKTHRKDGFVKSSRCQARKSDGRGNPPGCPISGGSASRPYLPQ
jgi:hypothetical protein